jgi:hypothetical protein
VDEYARIIADARRLVARGATPNQSAFEQRIRAVRGEQEDEALRQLAGVVAVHRARARFAEPPPPAGPAVRAKALRTRPTISGSLDVRREREFVLAWAADRKVASWEVRIAERPDVRSDYVVRDEHELPASVHELELSLGETPMRVHVVGRARDGRLVRRAVLTGVTRATWNDRWQRR